MNAMIEPLLIQDTPIDWDRYMLSDDDIARVIAPITLVERTKKVLTGFGIYEGLTLPWAKVQNQVRLRRSKLSIWAGITHHGKALALDTPLPTLDGWVAMGDVRVGDQLFGTDGEPCRVIAVTDVMHDRACYEVVFSDGERIVADADHLWETWDLNARRSEYNARQNGRNYDRPLKKFGNDQSHKRTRPAVRNTAEIAATLVVSSGYGRGQLNHSIPLAGPIQTPAKDLPIDPYLLGLWLGDGSTDSAQFHTADKELLEAFREGGFTVSEYAYKYSFGICGGFLQQLRAAGVLGEKHIPAIYLRASYAQRLALLQGLMDTDGHITPYGRCEFTSTLRHLADHVRELAISLGIDARLISGVAKIYGRAIGPKYRVTFTTRLPVFRLAEKVARINKKPSPRLGHRWIVSCSPVPSVPVKCIQVDSPDRLYLCGRSMIPTHNTQVVKQLCLHAMRAGEVVCIASLEENPEDTFADLAQQVYGRAAADLDRLDCLAGWAQNKLWLYDQQGMVSTDRILALMTYCVQEKQVTHFVIDSLMRLGIASDDFDAQRVFFNRATAHARHLNCHVNLVCHVRKQQSDDVVPGMFDVRGASAMVDQADNVFVVWRDKRDDRVPSEPAALLIVEKQRGRPNWLGKIRLWFDDETGQFLGNYGDPAAWYLPVEKF